jgi:hypothetical protein
MGPCVKLVEFQTTLQGRALQWYMKFVQIVLQGIIKTMYEVKRRFFAKLQRPNSEQHN